MKHILKKHKFYLLSILIFILTFVIFKFSYKFPNIIEYYYSERIFIVISKIQSSLFNIFPFSVFEILIISLIFASFIYVFIQIYKCFKNKKYKQELLRLSLRSITTLSIVYILFIHFWGFNYNRQSLSEKLKLDIRKSDIIELENLSEYLFQKVLILRKNIKEDSLGIMSLNNNFSNISKMAIQGYDNIKLTQISNSKYYSKPKRILFSGIMSNLGVSGIYSPFTGEVNINSKLPEVQIPFTLCHEMAHQRGYAKEDEANFISYIVCKNHENIEFKYSGYLMAFLYTFSKLRKYNPEKYKEISIGLSPGIRRDLSAINKFWSKYQNNIIEKSANYINDAYLKVNMQKDGIHSYGRIVDLLLAEYRTTI